MRLWASAIVILCLLTPAHSVVAAGETEDRPRVTLENPTPPARTTVTHDITIHPTAENSTTPLSVEFEDLYANRTLVVRQVTTTNGTTVEHSRVDGPDADGINETIRLNQAGSGPISTLTVTVTLGHPPLSDGRSLEVVARSGARTATASYTLQPIDATARSGPTGTFDRLNGTGFVYSGATVFIGERDISFRGELDQQLVGTGGDTAGIPLSTPIPAGQPTGSYSTDGTTQAPSVSVVTPQVSTFEVRNERGETVSGGAVPTDGTTTLTVVARSNFEAAEQLTLLVRDQSGLEVTESVTRAVTKPEGTDSTVRWTLNISAGKGTYTIAVEGSDDLTTGKAHQQTQIRLTDLDPSLTLDRPTVSRGERVTIQYTGAQTGSTRFVTVDSDTLSDDAPLTALQATFRSIENVQSTGFITADGDVVTNPNAVERENVARVFARAEIAEADSTETLQLDTTAVDTHSVDVTLHAEDVTPAEIAAGQGVDDTVSLFVTDASTGLGAPRSYTIGAETTVLGETSPGVDQVAMYVTDGDQYQLVDLDGQNGQVDATMDVSGSTYSREVVLSAGDTTGNKLLSFPGGYRVGVVTVEQFESLPQTINQSTFASKTDDLQRLRVTEGRVNLEVQSRNGEISTRRFELRVSGAAPGANTTAIVLVGPRGTIRYGSADVTDGTYSKSIRLGALSRGSIRVYAITTGRDGQLGDGTIQVAGESRAATIDAFGAYLRGIENQSVRQIGQRIAAETVGDTAGDDGYRVQLVQLASPRVTVDTIGDGASTSLRPSDPITVSGRTNVNPDDGNIRVTLQRNGLTIDDARITSWGTTWNATLTLTTEIPGTYTIRAELIDGAAVDYRTIEIQSTSRATTTAATPSQSTPTTPLTDEVATQSTREATRTAEPPATPTPQVGATQQAPPTESATRAESPTISTGYGLAILLCVGLVAYVVVRRREG